VLGQKAHEQQRQEVQTCGFDFTTGLMTDGPVMLHSRLRDRAACKAPTRLTAWRGSNQSKSSWSTAADLGETGSSG
jgi:hypothetical protein